MNSYIYRMLKDETRRSGVNNITNSQNQEIGNRFAFFADCLDLINNKAGEYYYFEADNHLTLIQTLNYSIEFQISSYNDFRAKNFIAHLKYILKFHPFFHVKDGLIKRYYSGVRKNIDNVLTYSGGHLKTDMQAIKAELNSIESVMSNNYIQNVITELHTCIQCKKHTLKQHSRDFNYLAKIVFSHFYIRGYYKRDIGEFISKLLQNEVSRHGDKIYVNSTLPIELFNRLIEHNRSDKKYNRTLFNDIKKYYENRNLKQQIEGLIDIDNRPKNTFTYLFKVDNLYLQMGEETILGLKFINCDLFKKRHQKKIKLIDSFLTSKSALVEYTVEAFTAIEGMRKSVLELKIKLDRIGFLLNQHLSLNLSGYITPPEDNVKEYIWTYNIYNYERIYQWDIESVNRRTNLITNPTFNSFLLSSENMLAQAFGEVNIHSSLQIYSKFTEFFTKKSLGSLSYSASYRIPPRVLAIAYILVLDEREDIKHTMKYWAFNAACNSYRYTDFISKEEYSKIRNRNKVTSLNEISRVFKHPHTQYRINKIKKYNAENDIEAFHYYTRYFLLLIQYRNIGEHDNETDEKFAKKLKVSIHQLLLRAFNKLVNDIKKPANAHLTPEKILENLIVKGKDKCDLLGISV